MEYEKPSMEGMDNLDKFINNGTYRLQTKFTDTRIWYVDLLDGKKKYREAYYIYDKRHWRYYVIKEKIILRRIKILIYGRFKNNRQVFDH